MIPPGSLVILDTNAVVQLVRMNPLGKRIEADLSLRHRQERPLISVVTVGECLALAEHFGWGAEKKSSLMTLLHQLLVLDLGRVGVTERYAAITEHCRRRGRTLSDNDRWIAATAAAAGAVLVSTDRDFEPLHPDLVTFVWIDPKADT